ncbi:MAG TPA: outer membrane protein assembly factor BamB [Woeseiaceae bacterium]|nr:outer membrane protein assembly factor BamB [Woeseiaceae bacterium]
MSKALRCALLAAIGLQLGACGMFSKDDEALKPAELVDVDAKIKIQRLWSDKLGADAEFLRLALRPAGDGKRIYAASSDGKVSAYDPESGKRLWRVKLDLKLTAGVGVGQGILVVVAANGNVIALGVDDGAEKWRTEIKGESLAVPAIGEGNVIVQSVDNRVRALGVFDGRERWTVIQSMPALTMRGSASPIIVGKNVIAGFDNGRLVAIDIASGDTAWEALLAPPSGRSDLERLSDIDGELAAVGQDIYAAGYHGRLASLAAESGQILWAVEISSYEGLSADWNEVYTVQDEGVLLALSRKTGAESWRQDILLRREPGLPVPFLTTIVTGDYEGYLHFFSNVDGDYLARIRQGGAAITSVPVVVGERLYVQSDSGELAAYGIKAPEKPKKSRDAVVGDDTPGEGA